MDEIDLKRLESLKFIISHNILCDFGFIYLCVCVCVCVCHQDIPIVH